MAAVVASWKTTTMGLGLILAGLYMAATGTSDHNSFEFVTIGVGLVLARDA